jgi:hypothetical protein
LFDQPAFTQTTFATNFYKPAFTQISFYPILPKNTFTQTYAHDLLDKPPLTQTTFYIDQLLQPSFYAANNFFDKPTFYTKQLYTTPALAL